LTSLPALRAELEAAADPERAPAMAAYMKDRFAFLGVTAADRRAAQRDYVTARAAAGTGACLDTAAALWREPEREFQYVGCDLLRRVGPKLPADSLDALRTLVATKSWWDTVDSLAKVVGAVVRAHPGVAPVRSPSEGAVVLHGSGAVTVLDDWVDPGHPIGGVDDPAMWVARAAILHQLGWKAAARPEVIFRYCGARIDHPDFFIRKAIGWALRDLARSRPDEVWDWVDAHPGLSALSRREATKHR